MSDFQKYLDEQLKDPEFEAEWKALATGINQADISKLETGNCNPSLRTLSRLAEGLGMMLRVEFVPMKEKKI